MKVVIVQGRHKGTRLEGHEGGPFFTFTDHARDSPQNPPALYRIFSKARPDDDRGDVYAAEWCQEHDAFRDRCPHAPPGRRRVWARFGPRRDQTQLEAGAPGTRESKWHLLANDRQVAEPWLTVCQLIVYGPIIEEYRSIGLTPIGAPICKNCKAFAGVGERAITGSGGAMTA